MWPLCLSSVMKEVWPFYLSVPEKDLASVPVFKKEAWPFFLSVSFEWVWPLCLSTPMKVWCLYPSVLMKEAWPLSFSPSEGGVASVPVGHGEGGVAFLKISPSERGVQ